MLDSILMAISGGALIGLAASAMLFFAGRVAGITGVVGGIFRLDAKDMTWRLAFLAGLLAGGGLLVVLAPDVFSGPDGRSSTSLIVAGCLVGFGARLGGGCTSGHGVCGLSRLSGRSLVATMTFMAAGFLMATLIEVLAGGAL